MKQQKKSEKETKNKPLNRRDFIKVAGVAAVGAGVGGCAFSKSKQKNSGQETQNSSTPDKHIPNQNNKILGNIIGGTVMMPYVIQTKTLSAFYGKQKAVEIVGPKLTRAAKFSLKFWAPAIDKPERFNTFPAKMKKNMKYWKVFYNINVTEESEDIFKIHVSNCPFCESLDYFGIPELKKYVCQGDWEYARDNSDKWVFERENQIGTGDKFCDHTYKRIQLF